MNTFSFTQRWCGFHAIDTNYSMFTLPATSPHSPSPSVFFKNMRGARLLEQVRLYGIIRYGNSNVFITVGYLEKSGLFLSVQVIFNSSLTGQSNLCFRLPVLDHGFCFQSLFDSQIGGGLRKVPLSHIIHIRVCISLFTQCVVCTARVRTGRTPAWVNQNKFVLLSKPMPCIWDLKTNSTWVFWAYLHAKLAPISAAVLVNWYKFQFVLAQFPCTVSAFKWLILVWKWIENDNYLHFLWFGDWYFLRIKLEFLSWLYFTLFGCLSICQLHILLWLCNESYFYPVYVYLVYGDCAHPRFHTASVQWGLVWNFHPLCSLHRFTFYSEILL